MQRSGASLDIFQSEDWEIRSSYATLKCIEKDLLCLRKEDSGEVNPHRGGKRSNTSGPPPSLDRLLCIRHRELEVRVPLLAFV
jgi:hypothetical protein